MTAVVIPGMLGREVDARDRCNIPSKKVVESDGKDEICDGT